MARSGLKALVAAVAGLVWLPPLSGADTVQGYVVHAATGQRVPSVEVAFSVDQGGALQEVLRKVTDEQGRFDFSGPFLEPGVSFSLAALYRGIPHSTALLIVGSQQAVVVEVYEPAQDDSAIRVLSHTLFLTVGELAVDVAHLVEVDNPVERVYAGQEVDGQRRVTCFVLPPGLLDLESHNGQLIKAGTALYYDTQPLLPGQTEIAFSFSLDAREIGRGYPLEVRYLTKTLNVFLQPTTYVPGPPFRDVGVVSLRGNQYRRVILTDLTPGQRILVPLPVTPSLRWALKWIALGAALLGAALTAVMAHAAGTSPQARGAVDQRVLSQCGEEVLQCLARLDDEQVGRGDDVAYRAERARLLQKAMLVFRRMEAQDGGR